MNSSSIQHNFSSPYNSSSDDVVTLLLVGKYMLLCYPTVWTVLCVGNIVSLLVFLRADMRKSHSNVYLAVLAAVDFVWVNTSTWQNIQKIVDGRSMQGYRDM